MQAVLSSPVFILGSHKSGSSLLRSLLDGHSDLYVLPKEAHYFQYSRHWVEYPYRSSLPSQSSLAELRQSLIDGAHRENEDNSRFSDNPGFPGFNLDWLAKSLVFPERPSPTQVVSTYLEALFYSSSGDALPMGARIVEKSVENLEFAWVLSRMFPNAKFLHIVRNPYAIAVAVRRMKMHQNRGRYPFLGGIYKMLRLSSYSLVKNREYIPNYFVLRFEDLLDDPKLTMSTVADFLEIPWSDSLVDPTIGGNRWGGNSTTGAVFGRISRTPRDAWMSDITECERYLAERGGGPVFRDYSYQRICHRPAHFRGIRRSGYLPVRGESLNVWLKNRVLVWMLKAEPAL